MLNYCINNQILINSSYSVNNLVQDGYSNMKLHFKHQRQLTLLFNLDDIIDHYSGTGQIAIF